MAIQRLCFSAQGAGGTPHIALSLVLFGGESPLILRGSTIYRMVTSPPVPPKPLELKNEAGAHSQWPT